MGAVAFYPHPLLSFNRQLKLGNPIISLREIADCSPLFATQKNPYKFTILSTSDGSRRGQPPQKGYVAGRMVEGEGRKLPQLSDRELSSSSNKEELLDLFERIKSSISKGETVNTTDKNRSSSENQPIVESVVDVHLQSGKEVKDTSSIEDGMGKKWRRCVPKNEQVIQNNKPASNFKLTRLPSIFNRRSPIPPPDFKLTRLPATFIKKSPIPSPSAPRGRVLQVNHETLANTEESKQLKFPKLEELKLPQLKQLAKARGIKGYSRMKKSELVKLLRS